MLNKTRAWLAAHRPRAWGAAEDRQPEQTLPQERMNRMYLTLKRRLSDKIEDVLDEACGIGDLQTAEELLSVLELMTARPPRLIGRERRDRTERLEELRRSVVQLRDRNASRRRRGTEGQTQGVAGP